MTVHYPALDWYTIDHCLATRLHLTNKYPISKCSPFHSLKMCMFAYDLKVNWRSFVSDVMWKRWKKQREIPIFENWLDRRRKVFWILKSARLKYTKKTASVAMSAIIGSFRWKTRKVREKLCPWCSWQQTLSSGQCRGVSYTSSGGVVPQNMEDLLFIWPGLVWCSHKEFRH